MENFKFELGPKLKTETEPRIHSLMFNDLDFYLTVRFKRICGSVRFGSGFKYLKLFGSNTLKPNRCRLLLLTSTLQPNIAKFNHHDPFFTP